MSNAGDHRGFPSRSVRGGGEHPRWATRHHRTGTRHERPLSHTETPLATLIGQRDIMRPSKHCCREGCWRRETAAPPEHQGSLYVNYSTEISAFRCSYQEMSLDFSEGLAAPQWNSLPHTTNWCEDLARTHIRGPDLDPENTRL